MAVRNFNCDRHSLISTIGLTMVRPGENNFKKLRFSEGWKMWFGFANIIFHKRVMLLFFSAEFTESALDICIQSLLLGPSKLGQKKTVSK